MLRAMVLAAGHGTRLGDLSGERPKPLLPVADVPLIKYVLALLAGHGIREIAINLHHLGEMIVAEVGDPAVRWSRETEILGTGGGVRRMADWLSDGGREPFLIINGKLIVDVDLGELERRHRASGAVATMVVRDDPEAARWGAIDVDDAGRVVGPALVARLPEGPSCIIRQGYRPALAAGEPIAALRYDGYFQEHSTPARYLEGNIAVLRGLARLRHPPGPLTGVDESAILGRDARLLPPFRVGARAILGDGAVIGPDVVVGAGARVAAGAQLSRCVVWPDAEARGTITDAIVTRHGVHQVTAPAKE